jgi:2-dehydropantoate 2-reductase
VIRSNSHTSSYVIGEPDGTQSARLEKVLDILKAGLPQARATSHIRREIWAKLCLNVPSSLLAVLTMSTGPELFANPDTRELYRQLGEETALVAASYGEQVGFDLQAQIDAAGNIRHPPSMLQDTIAGRPMEVDAQLCAVQDMARRRGVSTPLLDILLPLLLQRARTDSNAWLP